MSNGVQQSSGSALDGHLNPNDVITLIHGSDVATRIYEGSRTNNSSSVGQFSSPITQRIDGSLLVDGTLSASSIAANTGTLRALTVGERITVGTSTAPPQMQKLQARIKVARIRLAREERNRAFIWTAQEISYWEMEVII